MSERLSTDEQRALQSAVQDLNEKAWGIGVALVLAVALFVATNVLVLKGGSDVRTAPAAAGPCTFPATA